MSRSGVRSGFAFALMWFAAAVARADGVEPQRVALGFGWEPGIEFHVEATRTRIRAADEKIVTSSTASRYTIRVGAEGENLRIQFTDPTFEVKPGALSAAPSEQAEIMAKLADLMPDFVVTREGEFAGIHDLPGYQARLRKLLAEIMPPDLDIAVVAQMQSLLTSEAFLNSRASEEWNAIVGAWTGADFEIGVPAVYSRAEPVAIFPESEIRMNYAFSAEREHTCERGGVERGCVDLVMRSEADSEDTQRLIESFLRKITPEKPAAAPMFQTLAIENLLVLTTEPAGMIPHSYKLTKTIRGTVATPDGDHQIEQIDKTEVHYAVP